MARFAITGSHGAGKTSLCHAVAGQLKAQGINASIASETARDSYYLLSRNIVPTMEIEILGLQLVEEARCELQSDVSVCDRCVVDTVAYYVARFEGTPLWDESVFQAIDAFSRHYVQSYEQIYYLVDSRRELAPDTFRDTDPVNAQPVDKRIREVFERWNVAPTVIGRADGADRVIGDVLRYLSTRQS